MHGKLLYILAVVFSFSLSAQEITVNGGFVEDSLMIGEKVRFWISARYPQQLEMVFPDSTFDFSPFEYAGKEYFPTRLDTTMAFDSTVYTLQSFEISPVQRLSLPAVILKGRDSTFLFTPDDSILLIQLTGMVSDTTQLLANLEYQKVRNQFNYPLALIITGVLILLSAILYMAFGNTLQKKWKLRLLSRDYKKFSDRLTEHIRVLKANPDKTVAEKAINDWKQFMEKLDGRPFTKMTSREILSAGHTRELREVLRIIDRCIYGGIVYDQLYKEFHSIEDFTQHRYSIIKEEIMKGLGKNQSEINDSRKTVTV